MNATLSILLYIKRSKPSSDGTVPVYMRVTVHGKRIETSADKFVQPANWIPTAGKVKGNTEEARAVNNYLDAIKSQVYDYRTELIRQGVPVNFDNMRKKILKISEAPRSLVEIFQNHNDKMELQIGKKYAKGTHTRYKTTLSHTKEFMSHRLNVSDVDIRSIDLPFITDFEFYLMTVRKIGNNSTVKYLKNFGKIVRICLKNRWIDYDPFLNYDGVIDEVDGVFLTAAELKVLITKEFKITRLDQVRDIFVFCCYTGLAYADVKKLRKSHLSIGIDGRTWIFTKRQKTEIDSNVPLLPFPESILEKYQDDPKCINQDRLLPVLSNQKMNSYLKEIADLCGIEKELTFHASRHTFATTVLLANGVPIESVSKMMGHKNIKTTQHYAKTLDSTVAENMRELREKFKLTQDVELEKVFLKNMYSQLQKEKEEIYSEKSQVILPTSHEYPVRIAN